jgi:hypothetical protein
MKKYIPLPDWIKWSKKKGKYILVDNTVRNYSG